MKSLALLIAVASLHGSTLLAQETDRPKTAVELRTMRKGAELMATAPRRRPAPETQVQVNGGQLGGAVVELTQPEVRRQMLNLRQPVVHDAEAPNVFRDPVTGRMRGFVLFAIRF